MAPQPDPAAAPTVPSTPSQSTPATRTPTKSTLIPTQPSTKATKPTATTTPSSHALHPLRHTSSATAPDRTSISTRPSEDEGSSSRRRSFQHPTKKLVKRRRDGGGLHSPHMMEFPARLKEEPGEGTDEEEVLRPSGQGNGVFMNLNQSIFGLIAAAGSTVDFNDRFEGQSSDEDEGEETTDRAAETATPTPEKRSSKRRSHDLSQSTIFAKHAGTSGNSSSSASSSSKSERRRFSETRLLRSLPSLKTKLTSRRVSSKKAPSKAAIAEEDEEDEDAGDEGSSTPPKTTTAETEANGSPQIHVTQAGGSGATARERSSSMRSIAPVMSRMLEAKAELAASRPSFDLGGDKRNADDADAGGPSALARKLMEIFEFDSPEEVIDEYPCWLLQSVLLQGYMYITARHICFYAYLPKKANEVAKSGYLAKSGKRNPKYSRFWFRLKGDVLAYYRDPANLYFPHGQIDLRYGISATVTDQEREGGGVHFQVVTHQRTYYFRADSAPSAKEWVKSLQRVIFRTHNDGDSVKILLPLENVIDVEETQTAVDFADTCKIRVIDNDQTYAIDEYFFSFFDLGKEAVRVLRILVDDANQQHKSRPQVSDDASEASVPRTLHRSVRATLAISAPESPRASGEQTRGSFEALRSSFSGRRSLDTSQVLARAESPLRRSFSERGGSGNSNGHGHGHGHGHGIGRRSASASRPQASASVKSLSKKHDYSSDSFAQTTSTDDPSQASLSALVASASDEPELEASGSQILHGSDVFQATVGRKPAEVREARSTATYRAATATPGHLVDDSEGRSSTDGPDAGSLQNLARYGAYPLQRAGAYAGWLNRQSRRMSSLLATESMGYVEKVSGMWKGGHRHYEGGGVGVGGSGSGLAGSAANSSGAPVDGLEDPMLAMADGGIEVTGAAREASNERFRGHFALPATETLQATYFGYLMRVLPLYGKIYISNRSFCFRSLLPGTRTKLILPLRDTENVTKEKGFRFGFSGLVVVIRGHEELFFEFGQAEMRDDCAVTLLQSLEAARFLAESGVLDDDEKAGAETALAERDALEEEKGPAEAPTTTTATTTTTTSPQDTVLFDDPKASFLNFKPAKPLRITCLTIGSRGDVQPYIALGRGLAAEGHRVRIATHPEFEGWIRSHGLDYGRVEGDPGELMRICIENGTFTWQFLREANSKMRVWLDELLASAWTACRDAELLIESPSAMAGIHIAERLQIPYFRAFTMPWTRTRAYPHAFIMPEHKMGGAYNYITYVMFDNVFWKATASQINRWRNKTLGLPNTTLEKMQPNKVPFLYNFSPSVVPPPLDYSDWIRVTGYWFLDEGSSSGSDAVWTPPPELTAFLEKARADGKKVVYVGFGSILVPDPAKMTQEVIDAVLKADVRCILSKGWSDRLTQGQDPSGHDHTAPEVPLPPEIFPIKSAPHDWLFAQIDAAAHHGGSGTTGASLRAGIPTIIRPFFGDQFFFGGRVEDLGVGLCLKKWGAMSFARALWEATNSARMIKKAAALGKKIRQENGVDNAIQCIYRDMEYAQSLVTAKASKNATTAGETPATDALDEDVEESWTFVGDDGDPMQQSVVLGEGSSKSSSKGLSSRVLPSTGVTVA